MAKTTNQCFLCGADNHLVASCPKVHAMIKDPIRAKVLLRVLQDGLSNRGGQSPANSPGDRQPRPGTPPFSNRSTRTSAIRTLIEELHDDDTDADITVSQLDTDGEDTDGDDDSLQAPNFH